MGLSEDITGALRAQEHGHQPIVYGMEVVQGADVYNGSLTGDVAATLTEACGGTNTSGAKVVCVENHPNDSHVKISEDGMVQALSGRMGTGGGNVPMVMEPSVEISKTLNCMDDPVEIAAVDCRNGTENPDTNGTLQAKENGGQSLNYQNTVRCGAIVRRLTPLECERLQGYPDHWTDIGDWVDSKGKTHKGDSDSPRYKALGNSIALPFWQWMAKRMVQYLPENPTMASLFDGIGGFPLVFSRVGCEPVWASEIEEFPIAVTKRRFGEDEGMSGKEEGDGDKEG
jgi:DNA (cytosine-5)-methyltransferase 1